MRKRTPSKNNRDRVEIYARIKTTPEVYERLRKLATIKGCTLNQIISRILHGHLVDFERSVINESSATTLCSNRSK